MTLCSWRSIVAALFLAAVLGGCNAAPVIQPTPQIIYVTPAPVAAAPSPTLTPAPSPTLTPAPSPTPDETAGADAAVALAQRLRSRHAVINAAVDQLNADLKAEVEPAKETKELAAVLGSAAVTNALRDPRPVVVGAAKDLVVKIVAQLTDLGVDAKKLTGRAGKNVILALSEQ